MRFPLCFLHPRPFERTFLFDTQMVLSYNNGNKMILDTVRAFLSVSFFKGGRLRRTSQPTGTRAQSASPR